MFKHTKLSSYTFLENLGEGGQGKVVKVEDKKAEILYRRVERF